MVRSDSDIPTLSVFLALLLRSPSSVAPAVLPPVLFRRTKSVHATLPEICVGSTTLLPRPENNLLPPKILWFTPGLRSPASRPARASSRPPCLLAIRILGPIMSLEPFAGRARKGGDWRCPHVFDWHCPHVKARGLRFRRTAGNRQRGSRQINHIEFFNRRLSVFIGGRNFFRASFSRLR